MSGVVYMIESGHHQPAKCKIGRTITSAEERCKTLSTGNPEKLRVLHEWRVESDLAAFEREIHAEFAKVRMLDEGDATEFFMFEDVHATISQINQMHTQFIERRKVLQEAASIGPQTEEEFINIDQELEDLLTSRKMCSAQLFLLKSKRDYIDALIKKKIGNKAGVDGRSRLVTWKNQKVKRFDEAAFKAAHTELHAQFIKENEIRRFVTKE